MVGRQNADISDTMQLRDVAVATNFGTTVAVGLIVRCNIMSRHSSEVSSEDKLSVVILT